MSNLPELPYILEPQALNDLIKQGFSAKQLLIVDLGNPENYMRGHVPGAVHVPYQFLVSGAPPAAGKLAGTELLEELFSQMGLTPDTHVVAYDDDGGGQAGRLLWTLELAGHQRMSYLNGGLHGWLYEELPLEKTFNKPEPSQYHCHWDMSARATVEQIKAKLGEPNFVVWDARNPLEYTGEKAQAKRNGHIPGAINCEWTNLHDREHGLRIRPDAKEYLAKLGLHEGQEIVTHCQAHRRSAFTYIVGKSLGFNIKGYDGSWSEWGNLDDTPIEV
ncbi:sulfurtransferase [Halioxenophilus sp. WMMB6]|uniref:sulfurtransferase n=1 Tax=Halioxenophilus sp. WMMB6 TaxID=3073815 RepID=UPI00295E44A1|nr:rhodanese-like domain-containing protein [Halioxenophilus sp. WMMB6]